MHCRIDIFVLVLHVHQITATKHTRRNVSTTAMKSKNKDKAENGCEFLCFAFCIYCDVYVRHYSEMFVFLQKATNYFFSF